LALKQFLFHRRLLERRFARAARRDSGIDFPTVPDIKDSNLLGTVVNAIQNAIVRDSNSPTFLEFASEEFRPGGRGISDSETIALSIF